MTRLLAVSVGQPKTVDVDGRKVRTSIWKTPVEGRVTVERLNLAGDRQADLRVHGGPNKAVYAYPFEHYEFWRCELPGVELPWGSFGENLTTEGLLEPDIRIGDLFRIGTAVFRVTQPRMPCYKLAIRFDRPDIIDAFLASRRSGFYLAVEAEGEVGAGDAITRIGRGEKAVTIADMVQRHVDRQRAESGPALG